MTLDQKALDAATATYEDYLSQMQDVGHPLPRSVVAAKICETYLAATAPGEGEVADMCERLNEVAGAFPRMTVGDVCTDAAALLTRLARPEAEPVARNAVIEECAKVAEHVGNFGDYRREELTFEYGKPRFDLMTDIVSAIRALSPKVAPDDASAAQDRGKAPTE